MSDQHGGDDFEASLRARFASETETTPEPETVTEPEETPAPEASTEPPQEAEPQEPLRDDAGRFTNEQKLLEEYGLTQFRSVGDALKSYRELQGLQGRQAQEIGEIRQELQQYAALAQQATQPTYAPDELETFFTDNPHRIPEVAAAAYREGRTDVLDAALLAWEDIDRRGARQFEREIIKADLQKQIAPALAPVQKLQTQDELTAAFQNVTQRIPDILTVDLMSTAREAPELWDVIESGTQRERELAFENLYRRAKLAEAERTEAQQAITAAHAADSRAEKAAAVVASVSSRPASAEGKDAIDRFKQSILGVETGLVDRFANQ